MKFSWTCYLPIGFVVGLLAFTGCSNSPYPYADEDDGKVYYTAVSEPPKSLDPQKAYNVRDGMFVSLVYEGLFAYDYLARPVTMIPQLAKEIPEPKVVTNDAGKVESVTYTFNLQEGVHFIDDPCFEATEGKGRELIADDFEFAFKRMVDPKTGCPVSENFMRIKGLADFKSRLTNVYHVAKMEAEKGPADSDEKENDKADTKDGESGAKDKGNPEEEAEANDETEAEGKSDAEEKEGDAKPAKPSGKTDGKAEKKRPLTQVEAIAKAGDIEGIKVTGKYSFDLTMTEPYPQMLYWLAMNFVSAIPHEAVSYYAPDELSKEEKKARQATGNGREPIEFTLRPVGTGAFKFDWEEYNREARIVLTANPNWWGRTRKAPSTIFPEKPATPEDVTNGCWREEDAGKNLPFIDQIEFHLEKESLPRFNKFVQGYYDRSGVPISGFSQAISNDDLTDDMNEMGISMVKEIDIGVRYMLFNMDSDTLGAPKKFSDDTLEKNRDVELERRRKVRKALCLAVNTPEFHEKFYNGLGGVAQSPLPPGLFGYDTDYKNPYRTFDPELTEAKRLMKEAGFEGGIDEKTGERLKLNIPTSAVTPPGTLYFEFYKKAWSRLGVDLDIQKSDYNTFMDRVHDKNAAYDVLMWGWMMDYPDPENFLFLLYGPNSGKFDDNNVNYSRWENPHYDELFEAMETMKNDASKEVTYTDFKSGEEKTETLTRLQIIHKMRDVFEHELPWIPTTHDEAYILSHDWMYNVKQHPVTGPWSKFYNIDTELRAEKRLAWNKPILWPLFILVLILALFMVPAILSIRKERR